MAAPLASSSSDITTEGPVLSLINKRLRALRKKLNRISQMEDALVQGKILNKEQEETFRSKASVLAGIEELEKLREPLSQAVGQEIELAFEKKVQNLDAGVQSKEGEVESEAKGANDVDLPISDLLTLLYFGSVFDVATLMRAHDNMLTRTHERNCCLTYDYVTDDDAAGEPLKEGDLDLISMLGSLLVSRPVNSSLSHKNALQNCVEHAKLWLANAEQPVEPNSNITYAGLREKLNKIMASDYFTTAPEIKAPVEVAAAAGSYSSYQVSVHGSVIPAVNGSVPVEGSAEAYHFEEEQAPSSHSNEVYDEEPGPVEELHQGGTEVETASEIQGLGNPDGETDQNREVDVDGKEQYAPRKPYQNYRGGRGGGRRGFNNGRGGRGGRGGYQNGRNQYYDQPGGYYPRNNYNYRGRGGRGMGGNNYSHTPVGHNGHAQAAS